MPLNNKTIIGVITTTGAIIGIIIAINQIDDRYIKISQLDAMEKKVISSLEDFKKNNTRSQLESRIITLSDQLMQVKILRKKYGNDSELLEDQNRIIREREETKKKLEGMQ